MQRNITAKFRANAKVRANQANKSYGTNKFMKLFNGAPTKKTRWFSTPPSNNTSVPRLAINRYILKKNFPRNSMEFLSTNSNNTTKNKIKLVRGNVAGQNMLRRIIVIINNARNNIEPIPFNKYQTILNASSISELEGIGINVTNTRNNENRLKAYKILVLNELLILFIVIIGEILNFTVNGDLKQLRGKINASTMQEIEEGRQVGERMSRYFDPLIPVFPFIFVFYIIGRSGELGRFGGARGGVSSLALGVLAIAFGWTLISSPFIYGFNLIVYINDRKTEINFMQFLMLTYKTFFSSSAAIEYRNDINFYQLDPQQIDYLYDNAEKFKNIDINNEQDTKDFKDFLKEFLEIKLRALAEAINAAAPTVVETVPNPEAPTPAGTGLRATPTTPAPVRHYLPPRPPSSISPSGVSLGRAPLGRSPGLAPSPLPTAGLALRSPVVPSAAPSAGPLSPRRAYLERLEANKAARNAKVASLKTERGPYY